MYRSDYQRVREQFDPTVFCSLSQDFSRAFEDLDHADFNLEVDGTLIPCHKFILGARSDVFKAMFQHKNVKENLEGKVTLHPGTDVNVAKMFLKFIYTDALEDTSFAVVSQLLPLAEKYNVKKLSTLCGQNMLSKMAIENVSEIAVLGSLYNVSLLREKSIEFISQYPEKVMKTPGWESLLKQSPEVCTNIIYRLSRSSDKEVVVKSATRSSLN